jgi:hypothetical protein
MSLRTFQQGFLRSVMHPRDLGDEQRGLRVYANNIRGKLLEALHDTYEKVRGWVGQEAFEQHASAYVSQHAPSSWTLDDYGLLFPAYLGQAYAHAPEVEELAWLDLGLRRAFSGPDAPVMLLDAVTADDWHRVEFSLVPTLAMRQLETNAPALWAGLATGARAAVAPATPGSGVRIWRNGLVPQFQTMAPDEFACLDLALAGGTFGEICEWLAARMPPDAVAAHAGTLLRRWITEGLIMGLHEPH